MGQTEYSVNLAKASTPKEMEFVAHAFRAGQAKEQDRIIKIINEIESNSHKTRTPVYQDALFKTLKEKISGQEREYLDIGEL